MTDARADSTLRLGAMLKEYRPAAGAVRKVLWIALFCVCISAVIVCGVVSEAQSREWGGVVALSVIALVFLSPAMLGGYVLFQGRGARVAVHERGFTFHRGSKDSSVLWSEIESYIVATAARVVTKSGEVVELGGGIEGIDEIAQTIWDQTLKLMLPQLKAVLMSGSNAEFKGWKLGGKFLASYMGARSGFTVDALGITEKDTGRRILWSAVTGYEVAEETLGTSQMPIRVFRITDLTQTFATRADLLSNAHVLLALCQELTTPNATGG
jgi:hypothetical protein